MRVEKGVFRMNRVPPQKWKIEGLIDDDWVLWNYFKGTYHQAKEKAADLLVKLKYNGIRVTKP
jgi:hypothetical protein